MKKLRDLGLGTTPEIETLFDTEDKEFIYLVDRIVPPEGLKKEEITGLVVRKDFARYQWAYYTTDSQPYSFDAEYEQAYMCITATGRYKEARARARYLSDEELLATTEEARTNFEITDIVLRATLDELTTRGVWSAMDVKKYADELQEKTS